MFEILSLALAGAAGVLAFGFARGFVRRRLRFVDAIRAPWVPVLAAVGAAVVVLPVTILPLIGSIVTGFTAAVFGLGAGLGTASGVKALKRGE